MEHLRFRALADFVLEGTLDVAFTTTKEVAHGVGAGPATADST